MKRIVIFWSIIIIACSIAGCSQKKAAPINLPEEKSIQSIEVTIGNETERFSNPEWIRQCLSAMDNAETTSEKSLQDTPMEEDYIKIDINTENAVSTLFVYIEKGNYYIEQPYYGIYKIDLGIDTTTAIRMFLTQALAVNGFPFELKRVNANPYEALTEYEILDKLEKSCEHAAQGFYKDAAEVFRDMEERE